MQLWTDYEGVTIDGAFPLQKLLLPEGRSAFFSTAGPNGEPTVVRLIECHFDEDEILARWRCVEALSHPNFLKFARYGQTALDGRPIVYAVFEKVDANLAEVLDQGHLSVKDAAQLATDLVAALDVLHTHGFIHEHIEPRNIFAVNEVVKLRSDCIRGAPEGEEGRAAKRRDVRDLATVLLQALTQRTSVEGIPDSVIPAPLGPIIRNGLDGRWELENIKTALGGLADLKQPGAAKPVAAAAKPVSTAAARPLVAEKEDAPALKAASGPARQAAGPVEQLPLPLMNEMGDAENGSAEFGRKTIWIDPWGRKDVSGEDRGFSMRSRWFGAAGIFSLLLLLCTWAVVHVWNASGHKSEQAAAIVAQAAGQVTKPIAGSPVAKPAAGGLPRANLAASAGSRVDWRVIPFTYNRRADAEKKVSSLAKSHPELHPVVFSPSGHAPYLVSIGGVMDRDAAYALARRSRSLGLPRDTYAQNYSR